MIFVSKLMFLGSRNLMITQLNILDIPLTPQIKIFCMTNVKSPQISRILILLHDHNIIMPDLIINDLNIIIGIVIHLIAPCGCVQLPQPAAFCTYTAKPYTFCH